MIDELIQLAIVTLILVLCIRAVWRAVVIPPDLLRGARCGNCSYELGDIRDRCPECGVILRKAGIRTPLELIHKRGSTSTAVLAWSFLIFLLAVLANNVADQFRGPPAKDAFSRIRSEVILVPQSSAFTQPDIPAPVRYGLGIIADVSTGRDGTARHGSVSVSVSTLREDVEADVSAGNGTARSESVFASFTALGEGEAEIDPISLACTINGKGHPGPFDARAAQRLFGSAGLDPKQEPIASDARTLAAIISAIRNNPSDYFNPAPNAAATGNLVRVMLSSDATALPEPIDLVTRSIQAIGLLLCIIGVIIIIRRRRKLLSGVRTRYGSAAT